MAEQEKAREKGIIQHSDVQDYYGKTLSSSNDLKTNACCTKSNSNTLTERLRTTLSNIHPEVSNRYYGCGLVFPEAIEGTCVLDLGCGAGRDCFVLSQLVGKDGFVTGVDMTLEQIHVAREHVGYHGDKFGYSNVSFLHGLIEELLDLGVKKDSMDVIISNCVINLCPDKKSVLKDAYAILKNGGEMYFSDIYTDRPLSNEVKTNKILQGECIGGALEWRELMSLASEIGFAPPVLVEVSSVSLNDSPALAELLGDTQLCSATYRLYKVPTITDTNSTQEVTYNGTISDHLDNFKFSNDISFDKGTAVVLPSSVSNLLKCSRLAEHFTFNPSTVQSSHEELSTYLSIDPFKCMKSTENDKKGQCCGKGKSPASGQATKCC